MLARKIDYHLLGSNVIAGFFSTCPHENKETNRNRSVVGGGGLKNEKMWKGRGPMEKLEGILLVVEKKITEIKAKTSGFPHELLRLDFIICINLDDVSRNVFTSPVAFILLLSYIYLFIKYNFYNEIDWNYYNMLANCIAIFDLLNCIT